MRRYIIVVSACMAACLVLAGCSAGIQKTGGREPEIVISEIREVPADTKSKSVRTPVPDDSEMHSFIDNAIVDMLGNSYDEIASGLESEIEGLDIDGGEGGVTVITAGKKQRDMVMDIMESYIDGGIVDAMAGHETVKINYDMEDGYIDVYCDRGDADAVDMLVSDIVGMMAFGQRICDNSCIWGITITVSDAETGNMVKRGAVSDDDSFKLRASDWDDMHDAETETLESESTDIADISEPVISDTVGY